MILKNALLYGAFSLGIVGAELLPEQCVLMRNQKSTEERIPLFITLHLFFTKKEKEYIYDAQ